MQMQLPIFPSRTKLINNNIGVFEQKGNVYYLHNGLPIYCHDKNDLNTYRYVVANLVKIGICKPIEISYALGVSTRSIQRYARSLQEKGTDWFFNRKDNRGQCYKLKEELLKSVQEQINEGIPVKQIAQGIGVTEGSIRYHLRKGKLKKKK